MSNKSLSTLFRDFMDASGISGLIADVRAHTKEVRRAQEDFQRQMQWTVDNKGLDGLEAQEKRARDARRAARRHRFGF
ncbi:MAG: hypothetical protein KKA05_04810 [Alphaproteobacteria bacterium]|nr:hypothetical protein [Alphaproteobacteria bacterium]